MAAPSIHCFTTSSEPGSDGSITITKPTSGSTAGPDGAKNAAAGDYLLVVIGNDSLIAANEFVSGDAPDGTWTFIGTVGNSSSDCHTAAYLKKLDGSEGASFEFTSNGIEDFWGICILLSGVEPTQASAVNQVGTGVVDTTPPLAITGVNTDVDDCIAFAIYAYDGADHGGFSTSGTGWVELTEVAAGSGGAAAAGGVSYRKMTGQGATGTCTISVGSSDGTAGRQFAIAPGAAPPAGDIAGTASQAFSNSGALTGKGALAASASQAFTASAALSADGVLAGAGAAVFTSSATLTAKGALAGVAAMAFAASGLLTSGPIAGVSSPAFTATGTLTAKGTLAGVVATTFTPSATLVGNGALAGAVAMVFAATCQMAVPGRQNFYAESLGESTVSSSTWTDKVSLSFTPDASSDYWVFWSCRVANASTGNDVRARLRDDTGAATLREVNMEVKDADAEAGDYLPVFGIDKFTSGGSPGSQELSIEFSNEATSQAKISHASILVIKADADDQYAESEGESTNALGILNDGDAALLDKVSLVFTPGSEGDYLIVASAEMLQEATGVEWVARLKYGASEYTRISRRPESSDNWEPYNSIVKLTLPASEQTLSVQWATHDNLGSGDVAHIRHAAILALRLDKFANNYYAESRGVSTTSSDTYGDKVTLNATPVARDHAVLMAGVIDSTDLSFSVFGRLTKDGVSQFEGLHETRGGTETGHAIANMQRQSLAAAATEWKVQFKRETGASAAHRIYDAAIAVLDLGEAEEGNDPIAGTASSAFTNTGVLTGRGALAGSAANVFTNTGALTARGALAGTATATFSPTATLLARGTLSGSAAIVFANTAALLGRGALAGSAAAVFDVSGTLELPDGALVGVSNLAFTAAATLTGRGALTGSAALAFTNAALLQGRGTLVGTSPLAFTTTAALDGLTAGDIEGAASSSFSATGTLTAKGALVGVAELEFSATAEISGEEETLGRSRHPRIKPIREGLAYAAGQRSSYKAGRVNFGGQNIATNLPATVPVAGHRTWARTAVPAITGAAKAKVLAVTHGRLKANDARSTGDGIVRPRGSKTKLASTAAFAKAGGKSTARGAAVRMRSNYAKARGVLNPTPQEIVAMVRAARRQRSLDRRIT